MLSISLVKERSFSAIAMSARHPYRVSAIAAAIISIRRWPYVAITRIAFEFRGIFGAQPAGAGPAYLARCAIFPCRERRLHFRS